MEVADAAESEEKADAAEAEEGERYTDGRLARRGESCVIELLLEGVLPDDDGGKWEETEEVIENADVRPPEW